jgi:hypothetical protein
MRKDYLCKACNYMTKDNGNYKKHIKTKKHIEKLTLNGAPPPTYHPNTTEKSTSVEPQKGVKKSKHVCTYCLLNCSRLDSLKRHMRKCKEKRGIDKDCLIKSQKETISKYEEELHYFKELLKLTGGNKNTTAFNYINRNYKTAKPLKTLTYEEFTKNHEIQYSQDAYDNYNTQLSKDMLYAYKHGTVGEYVGGTIIKIYKKKDPNKQSIWTTDQNRLKYVIRELIDDNKVKWVADGKGINTSKLLIDPIIIKIKKILNEYIKNHCIGDIDMIYTTSERSDMIHETSCVMQIIRDIDNKKISKIVLKYLASHFGSYNDNLKNIKNSKKNNYNS